MTGEVAARRSCEESRDDGRRTADDRPRLENDRGSTQSPSLRTVRTMYDGRQTIGRGWRMMGEGTGPGIAKRRTGRRTMGGGRSGEAGEGRGSIRATYVRKGRTSDGGTG